MRAKQNRNPGSGTSDFMDWVQDVGYAEAFEEYMGDFFGLFEQMTDVPTAEALDAVGQGAYNTALGAAIEGFVSTEYDEIGFLVDEFLETDGNKLRPVEMEFLKALSRSSVSLYEVVEVVPKSHVVIRNAFGDPKPLYVREVLGSQQLVQWQWLVARVLEVDGGACFSGTSLVLEPTERDAFTSLIREAAKNCLKDVPKYLRKDPRQKALALQTVLRGSPTFAVALWLAAAMERLLLRPALVVTGGEEFCIVTLRYGLNAEPTDIEQAFVGAEDFATGQLSRSWIWQPEGGDEDRVLHAFFVMEEDALVVTAMARSRADRADERVRELLGLLVEPLDRHEGDSAELTPELIAQVTDLMSGGSDEEDEGIAAAANILLAEHYYKTLDEPIPMLGGKTPRELAQTSMGKREVAEWLKTLERMEGIGAIPSGQPPFDFYPLWVELGVEDLRK